MPEHVLIVGVGQHFPARFRAARPGTVTTVMCRVERVHKVRDPQENARVIALRERASDEEWIALAAAVHAQEPFTRIATVGEHDQNHCAAIGAALGLRTHRPETVALVHDKHLMRARLSESGLDSTAHALAAGEDDVRSFLRAHGGSCVVKPVAGLGSAGVALVRAEADAPGAWARASGNHQGIPDAGVIVEQFHEGEQFSVEAFTEAGEHVIVSVTRKFSDPVTFVELGHVAPAALAPEQRKEVETFAVRVLDAIGVEFGATHTEIVLSPAGPRLIETHVRFGGDEIPELTLDATNVDLADCIVRQTLGDSVLPGIRATLAEPREPVCSAIWFAAVPGAGTLEEVSGVSEARDTPGVTAVQVLASPGTELGGLQSSDSRVAYVRARGTTPEEALTAARLGVGQLEFHVRSRAHAGDTV
jgi:biotin carboxylase